MNCNWTSEDPSRAQGAGRRASMPRLPATDLSFPAAARWLNGQGGDARLPRLGPCDPRPRSTRSRLSVTASKNQEQATHRSQPVGSPGNRPLKTLTSIEWFIREASKRLNSPATENVGKTPRIFFSASGSQRERRSRNSLHSTSARSGWRTTFAELEGAPRADPRAATDACSIEKPVQPRPPLSPTPSGMEPDSGF
jgi:hypothetical protein